MQFKKDMTIRKVNGWVIDAGYESPGWYNIRIRKEKYPKSELILSAAGVHAGEDYDNTEWIFGVYYDDDPVSQEEFPNKKLALAHAERYMRSH